MLAVLYALMGVLGAWAGNKVVRVSVKFRSLAPPITACIGLTTLFSQRLFASQFPRLSATSCHKQRAQSQCTSGIGTLS